MAGRRLVLMLAVVVFVVLGSGHLTAAGKKKKAPRPPELPGKVQIDGKTLFVPFPFKLYTYTATNFTIPFCDPLLSNSLTFRITPTANKGAVLQYNFDPNYFNDGAQFSFSVLDRITLDTTTGVLQLESYGASLTFDLAKLLPKDNLQNINRCRDRKTTKLVNDLTIYDFAKKTAYPVLTGSNAVLDNALSTLISAVKFFSKPQPQCDNPNPANGDAGLARWAQWLNRVRKLPGAAVSCS